jgi:CheY-like chemotaxis protein
LSVLVVDDCPDTTFSFSLLLEIAGHRAQVANDGQTALQSALVTWPDVVLLDVVMPGMNGYEVAKQIRDLSGGRPRPWLVAVTGLADERFCRTALNSGIDQVFVKPVDVDVLLQHLDGLAPPSRLPVRGRKPRRWFKSRSVVNPSLPRLAHTPLDAAS